MLSIPNPYYIISLCCLLLASHRVKGEVLYLTPQELMEGIQNRAYAAVIDVRSKEDWDKGHIPNATLVASLNEMDLPPLPKVITGSCNKKDQKIVVTCRTGARAAVAANKLVAAGYKATIYNGGGTDDWTTAGFELVQTDSLESCSGEYPLHHMILCLSLRY